MNIRYNEFGLGPHAYSDSEFWLLKIMNIFFGHLIGLLVWEISPSQGLYLPRTAQHRKMRTHIHGSSGIQTHDPSVRVVDVSTCLRPRGYWERLHYTKYYKSDYVKVYEVGRACRTHGEMKNACDISVVKSERERLLGSCTRRWEDNIKMDLREIGWKGVDWVNLDQDRDKWRAFVNAIMNLRVP
jgi:hypothetical protein